MDTFDKIQQHLDSLLISDVSEGFDTTAGAISKLNDSLDVLWRSVLNEFKKFLIKIGILTVVEKPDDSTFEGTGTILEVYEDESDSDSINVADSELVDMFDEFKPEPEPEPAQPMGRSRSGR